MVDFFKFTEQVNLLHPTALLAMKFTPEICDTETQTPLRKYSRFKIAVNGQRLAT